MFPHPHYLGKHSRHEVHYFDRAGAPVVHNMGSIFDQLKVAHTKDNKEAHKPNYFTAPTPKK
jgi:hypothetical protein